MSPNIESRTALKELIELLQEVDKRWASEEWRLNSAEEISQAHRAMMHMLEGGIAGMFENNAGHPLFRRIVTPTRKFSGDNPDAIYFDAPVSAERRYRVRGNTAGAVYVSFTVEIGSEDGGMASKTGGVFNQTEFDVDQGGNFTIYLGGEKRDRNWFALPKGASRVTTRHYYEEPQPAAANPEREPVMHIENLDPEPPPVQDDASVAAGMRRVAQFIRSRTLLQPPMAEAKQPAFVGIVPNVFPKPVPPGDMGLAALDAHYSLAPFVLGPDDALLMRGRWPDDCLFANVCLWNRFQQTYDYQNRKVSINRAQTKPEKDGNFVIVLAHKDPGVPNWIDTEGNPFGLVFWRYFMAKSQPETPQAELVPWDTVKS